MAGIGEASAVVQVVSAGLGFATALNTYLCDVRDARDTILGLSSDLGATCGLLRDLNQLILKNESQQCWSDDGRRNADKCVSDSERVILKLRQLMQKSGVSIENEIVDRDEIDVSKFRKVLWPMYKPKLEVCRRELQTIKIDILLAQTSYLTKAGATEMERIRHRKDIPGLLRCRKLALEREKEAKLLDDGKRPQPKGQHKSPSLVSEQSFDIPKTSRKVRFGSEDDVWSAYDNDWSDSDSEATVALPQSVLSRKQYEFWMPLIRETLEAEQADKIKAEEQQKELEAQFIAKWKAAKLKEAGERQTKIDQDNAKLKAELLQQGLLLDQVDKIIHNLQPQVYDGDLLKLLIESSEQNVRKTISGQQPPQTARRRSQFGPGKSSTPNLVDEPDNSDDVDGGSSILVLFCDNERVHRLECPAGWLDKVIKAHSRSKNAFMRSIQPWKDVPLDWSDRIMSKVEEIGGVEITRWRLLTVHPIIRKFKSGFLGLVRQHEMQAVWVVFRGSKTLQFKTHSTPPPSKPSDSFSRTPLVALGKPPFDPDLTLVNEEAKGSLETASTSRDEQKIRDPSTRDTEVLRHHEQPVSNDGLSGIHSQLPPPMDKNARTAASISSPVERSARRSQLPQSEAAIPNNFQSQPHAQIPPVSSYSNPVVSIGPNVSHRPILSRSSSADRWKPENASRSKSSDSFSTKPAHPSAYYRLEGSSSRSTRSRMPSPDYLGSRSRSRYSRSYSPQLVYGPYYLSSSEDERSKSRSRGTARIKRQWDQEINYWEEAAQEVAEQRSSAQQQAMNAWFDYVKTGPGYSFDISTAKRLARKTLSGTDQAGAKKVLQVLTDMIPEWPMDEAGPKSFNSRESSPERNLRSRPETIVIRETTSREPILFPHGKLRPVRSDSWETSTVRTYMSDDDPEIIAVGSRSSRYRTQRSRRSESRSRDRHNHYTESRLRSSLKDSDSDTPEFIRRRKIYADIEQRRTKLKPQNLLLTYPESDDDKNAEKGNNWASRNSKEDISDEINTLDYLLHTTGSQIYGRDDEATTREYLDLTTTFGLSLKESPNKESDRSSRENMFNSKINGKHDPQSPTSPGQGEVND